MMFATGETTRLLFETIHASANLTDGMSHFTWVGPDAWVNGPSALPVHEAGYMEHLQGKVVAVAPLITDIGRDFDRFFTGYRARAPHVLAADPPSRTRAQLLCTALAASARRTNPAACGCASCSRSAAPGTRASCRNSRRSARAKCFLVCTSSTFTSHIHMHVQCTHSTAVAPAGYKQSGDLGYLVNAVFAYAHAFKRYEKDGCANEHRCDALEPAQINSARVVNYLSQVNFTGAPSRLASCLPPAARQLSSVQLSSLRMCCAEPFSNETFHFRNGSDGEPRFSLLYFENGTWNEFARFLANENISSTPLLRPIGARLVHMNVREVSCEVK